MQLSGVNSLEILFKKIGNLKRKSTAKRNAAQMITPMQDI